MNHLKAILLVIAVMTAHSALAAQPFDYKYPKKPRAYVWHAHNEASYQRAYCSVHGGVEEYVLPDKTRVDCLTDTHAIEFDFADKKYEAVGQALHYAVMTGKKPGIVLILDKKYQDRQMHYYDRLVNIGKHYGIKVEYVTEDILNLDKNGKCPYKDCKCNKYAKKSK